MEPKKKKKTYLTEAAVFGVAIFIVMYAWTWWDAGTTPDRISVLQAMGASITPLFLVAAGRKVAGQFSGNNESELDENLMDEFEGTKGE